MAVTHGMDAGAVEALAELLRGSGERLLAIGEEVDGLVAPVVWAGPDAERFVHEWWPAHRARLADVGEALGGLGRSASHNADDQMQTSGAVGPGGAAVLISIAAGVAAVGAAAGRAGGGGPSAPAPSPPAPAPSGPQAGAPGATSGSLPGSGRTWQQVQQAYESRADDLGLRASNQAGGAYGYQCTSWAMFRWRELAAEHGLPSPQFGTLPGGRTGHGAQMASLNGGSVNTPPSLGAMASYGDGGYGHVMIVEEVADGGSRIRVSEMNAGDRDYENGHANEYRSSSELARQPDGSWRRQGGRNVGAITFARLPGT